MIAVPDGEGDDVADAPPITTASTLVEATLDDAIVGIDISPVGRLAVLSADGRVMVDRPQRSSSPVGGAVRGVSWVDDSLLAVADHRAGVVLAGGGEPTLLPLERVRSVVGRPERVVAIGGDVVWTLDRDGRSQIIQPRCEQLHDVAFVTASIAAAVGTAGLAIVDLALGVLDTRVELDALVSVTADPTADKLAMGDLGGSIHIVRVGDESDGRELTGYPDRVRHLAWADLGAWLLAASDDELTCWPMVGDPGDQWPADEPVSCVGHDEPITVLSATPIHDLAATGDAGGRVAIWSLRAPHQPVVTAALTGEITALCWSGDGSRLAAGDVNGSLHVWVVCRGEVA